MAHDIELTVQARSLELIYALNAVATALQSSIRSEEDIYTVFQRQTIALKLRGGISLLDEGGKTLIFKTVAFTNPLRRILRRYEHRLEVSARGYSVPVGKVDVYQQVIQEGRSVYVPDTSVITAQVIPKQARVIVKPLLAILGTPPGIFTPLIYEGKIKGMLNIVGPNLTESDIPTMQAFANQIAVALENARLVQKLEAANAELQLKVAELERFTYTISHELKSPVITMKNYLGSIERDLQTRNYERALKDIQRVSAASDKLNVTISDLLELSRIGRIINPPEEVDANALIQDALGSLDAQIRSRNTAVHVAPNLPHLYGDPTRLREVFENLIVNAVKFMGEQANPVIEIGARGQGDAEIVFYVRDNGMGIDPQYHDRVFGLFEKLDVQDEGTGIGLALVRRIVEAHGGRVWVESEGAGKGSTFCFTIPGGGK